MTAVQTCYPILYRRHSKSRNTYYYTPHILYHFSLSSSVQNKQTTFTRSAGIVGYITNVLALEMTFRPIEFFGIELFRIKNQPWGLFGWQGIIPTKSEKMASICFDLMTTKLLNLKEIFDRLDPQRFSEVMEDAVLLMLDSIVNEVALKYMPYVWKQLPKDVKDEIVVVMNIESETFLTTFMEEVKEHIDDILDIKQMTVAACVREKRLVNKIFQECGDK